MPLLLYGLDVCPVSIADRRSFDFAQTRLLMKIFKTGTVDIINECRIMFGIRTVSDIIQDRKRRFLSKFLNINGNSMCSAVSSIAKRELMSIV